MAEARLNKDYAVRLSVVGAIMVGLAVWSVYDGAIAWPRENVRLAELRPSLLEGCAKGMASEMWLSPLVKADEDPETAERRPPLLHQAYAQKGWKPPSRLVQELSAITQPMGKDSAAIRLRAEQAARLFSEDVYPRQKLQSQYIQAVVTLVLGALAFFAVLSKRKTVYVVDDEGLRGGGFGADPVPWSDVKSADWSKFDEKGILGIVLASGKTVKLDGWHFKGVRDIAAEVQKHFPR